MKIAAGIIGLLIGFISLLYVGAVGGVVGSSAGWLGSWGPSGNSVSDWAAEVKLLSFLSPILALFGGGLSFKAPKTGSVLLLGSAFCHYQLMGFGSIGNLFIIPTAVAGVLALIDGLRELPNSSQRPVQAHSPRTDHGASSAYTETETPRFDQAKWTALVQYDEDISAAANTIRPLGAKWIDELAAAYLALNDKSYLPQIVQQISDRARADAEQQQLLLKQQRADHKAFVDKLKAEEEENRRKWEERGRVVRGFYAKYAPIAGTFLWGTTLRRWLTLAAATVVVVALGLQVWSAIRAAYAIRFTHVNVARDAQNGLPVDFTALLAAPATPALSIGYVNAAGNGSDHISATVLSGGRQVANCDDQVLSSGTGEYLCHITNPLPEGDYDFVITLNGKPAGDAIFKVTPAVYPVSITQVNVARDVQNSQPVDMTASLTAPATPVLFVRYANAAANGSDHVVINVFNGTQLLDSCADRVLSSGDGSYWCRQNGPLAAGDYSFQLVLNGNVVGTYPFTVVPPASSITLTQVNVARDIQNNQPVDFATTLASPATPVLFANYVNARPGNDHLSTIILNGSTQVASCTDYVPPAESGSFWCHITNGSLGPGSYVFQLSINGQVAGTYPFTVQ